MELGGKQIYFCLIPSPSPPVSTQNCKDLPRKPNISVYPKIENKVNHLNHHITKGSYFQRLKCHLEIKGGGEGTQKWVKNTMLGGRRKYSRLQRHTSQRGRFRSHGLHNTVDGSFVHNSKGHLELATVRGQSCLKNGHRRLHPEMACHSGAWSCWAFLLTTVLQKVQEGEEWL